jgi:RNA polymerase sigma-70 factor, ECF subfamily
MSHDDNAPKLGRFEYGIVKRKVRQIIGRAGFKKQDREDLEHELLTRLLQSLKSFNPDVAHRKAFVTAVVERDVANILRDKQAEKRDHRRIGSLHVSIEVTEDGPVELTDIIGNREHNSRRCCDPLDGEELAQLVFDLAGAMQLLPEDLRHLAEQLKTKSKAQIARELGMPRTTLHERVRTLRQRFEQAGLREYV